MTTQTIESPVNESPVNESPVNESPVNESPVKIHRPRPRPGQVILAVNLSEVTDGKQAIATLTHMGHTPQLRLYQFKTGVGVLAILKDEQFDQTPDDDYLMDEWLELNGLYGNSGAILWRGKVQAGEIAA